MRIFSIFILSLIYQITYSQIAEKHDSLFINNNDSLYEYSDSTIYNENDSLEAENADSLLLLENEKFKEAEKKFEKIILSDSAYIAQLENLVSVFDLTYNEKVKGFINLYANRRRNQVGNMLGLSEHYFPLFEEHLDKYNLPLELRNLPIIESALNTKAKSKSGAVGLWQFMYATGKIYGLEINSYVDERMDPVKSTIAASNFLKDLYKIYGDWTLAIAAYNCGAGNVNKAIRRSGGKRNFWEIYYKLPKETRGYVPAFIAANYIMNYYKNYNITPKKIDLPLKTDTILINEFLHFQQVSEVLNIPIETLRDLNPQYKIDIIPAKIKSYTLKLPVEYIDQFIYLQDSIFNYKDSIFFNDKNRTIAPSSTNENSVYTNAPSKNMVAINYTVKQGDNVGLISNWYNVNTSDLTNWNNLHKNRIRDGQKIVIYKNKNVAPNFININKMSFAAKQKMIGKDVAEPKTTTKASTNSNKYVYYTVKNGDNFWSIAKRYDGISGTDIMKLNKITEEGSLKIGQKLKIKLK